MADLSQPQQGLAALPPKPKEPQSVRVLEDWVKHADVKVGAGGRLAWLVASTVVIAALQRAVDATGEPRFLLKGGTLLQHRLGHAARATKDVDGLVRGDIDDFLAALDDALVRPWGPLTLRRERLEVIATPTRLVKPRRFDVVVELRGRTWRRVQVEVAPDEAGAGDMSEPFAAPSLGAVGLPSPDRLVGLALRFQAAQKIHACTDPHDPPSLVNDRARDVVDLLLLRDLGVGSPAELRAAVVAVFAARAADARALGHPERTWPARVAAHQHWRVDLRAAATSAGLDLHLDEAVAGVNAWLEEIDAAG